MARAFCVRCGATAPPEELFRGLCARCLPGRFPGVTHPPLLKGRRCPRCSSLRLEGRGPAARDIGEVFRGRFRIAPELRRARLELTSVPADPWGGTLRYVLEGALGEVPFRRGGEVPFRLKPEACEDCSRLAGNYYEGLVQVRATGRPLTAEERARAVAEAAPFGVARVGEEGGGLDFYLASARETKRLARRLAGALAGTTSASPKIAGRRDGRDIYRVARVVRLRPFQPGDVVRMASEGHLLQVRSWKGAGLVAVDLATGRRRTVDPSGAVLAGRGTVRATVVSSGASEIQLLDPDSLRTVTLPRPPFLEQVGGEVSAVRTDRGLVLVP